MNPGLGPEAAVVPAHARPRVCVAVVDDDTVVREGLRVLLTGFDVATFDSHEQLLNAAPQADVVILDLHLDGLRPVPRRRGAAAVFDTAQAGYCVLIYTNERRRAVLAGCLAAGARGIVHKTDSIETLAEAVSALASGQVMISDGLVSLAELADRHGRLRQLSARQKQVLTARARGESYSRIAQRLYITEATAQEHMAVVAARYAEFLAQHSPADLEKHLGVGPGDLLEWMPPTRGAPTAEPRLERRSQV